MAERRGPSPSLHLEYVFDRLLATKLEQVYAVLVPDYARRVASSTGLGGANDEDSCDLRPSLLGAVEGRQDHCQSNGSVSGIRTKRRLQRTG